MARGRLCRTHRRFADREAHHRHSGCERKRQRDSAYGQVFEWTIDDTDVWRERLVNIRRLVKTGNHMLSKLPQLSTGSLRMPNVRNGGNSTHSGPRGLMAQSRRFPSFATWRAIGEHNPISVTRRSRICGSAFPSPSTASSDCARSSLTRELPDTRRHMSSRGRRARRARRRFPEPK
jgi:hypothetical protein